MGAAHLAGRKTAPHVGISRLLPAAESFAFHPLEA